MFTSHHSKVHPFFAKRRRDASCSCTSAFTLTGDDVKEPVDTRRRGSVMTVRKGGVSMRAKAMCLILLGALFVPMAAGSATLASNSALEGAPFSSAEHHPIID